MDISFNIKLSSITLYSSYLNLKILHNVLNQEIYKNNNTIEQKIKEKEKLLSKNSLSCDKLSYLNGNINQNSNSVYDKAFKNYEYTATNDTTNDSLFNTEKNYIHYTNNSNKINIKSKSNDIFDNETFYNIY